MGQQGPEWKGNMGLKILGTGKYLPSTVVTNEDFTRIVDTSDEWIVKRTGMKERRIASEPTHVMAERAAGRRLRTRGFPPRHRPDPLHDRHQRLYHPGARLHRPGGDRREKRGGF